MSTTVKTNFLSLDSLPVEILYRILDRVDGQTILFSFRNVCKKFEAITDTYNRHELNTSSLSKADLNFICTVVSPEDVISLTLSDIGIAPGPSDIFFSLFDINRCIRLRSLNLSNINDNDLQVLLRHVISSCPLTSLSIEFPENESAETLALFVSVISKPTLRRITANLSHTTMNKITWPVNCSLQFLEIAACTLTQFCAILDHSPNLRALVVRNEMVNYNGRVFSKSYPQLTSLSLCNMTYNRMEIVESMLSLTPSLTYLKIVDWHPDRFMFSGFHWKNLIITHLPHLDKFEFFFCKSKSHQFVSHYRKSAGVKSCIARFCKAFWRETKRWNVGCTYDLNMESIILYSMPICLTSFSYDQRNLKTSIGSTTMVNTEDDLQLSDQTASTITTKQENSSLHCHLFNKLTDLKLRICGHQWTDLLNLFSIWINPSHLVTLALTVHIHSDSIQESITMLSTLLEQTDNIRSLSISYKRSRICRMQTIRSIYAILPRYIKDLQIEIMSVDDLYMIFDRLSYLSNARLVYSNFEKISNLEIIEWLKDNVADFIYHEQPNRIDVWLGKYTKKPIKTKIKIGAKRVKLSHNS